MSKKKRKYISRTAGPASSQAKSASGDVVTGTSYPTEEIKWWREAIEGLVVAIVLALMIRGFEAEAFVIPTGSMAPTLRGRHKDVQCEECQNEYAVGASEQVEGPNTRVYRTVCPICFHPQVLQYDKGRDATFSGDRILVNKFSYDPLGDPERFDVIVFKNPNQAKQNYIKRLCGLPGETLRIKRGDIYVRPISEPSKQFEIATKPPRKMRALLQAIDDTQHVSETLRAAGMPARWQPDVGSSWKANATNQAFQASSSKLPTWIRYRNFIPTFAQWDRLQRNLPVDLRQLRASLVSDTYAYNSHFTSASDLPEGDQKQPVRGSHFFERLRGKNWVGDLAMETEVAIQSETGQLILDLVEGGWHFRCTIDVASGKAGLSIQKPDGQAGEFLASSVVTGQTSIRGAGSYELLFSNVDSGLRLWVNDTLVEWDNDSNYRRRLAEEENLRPFFGGPSDPGDAAPAAIGAQSLAATVNRIRVLRDVYYVAADSQPSHGPDRGDYTVAAPADLLDRLFTTPEAWADARLFGEMRETQYDLVDFEDDSKDQFFPMGDNSPASLDARLWPNNYVERQLLIGEAVFIYFPHPWKIKLPGERFKTLPIYPKFSRMGVIR